MVGKQCRAGHTITKETVTIKYNIGGVTGFKELQNRQEDKQEYIALSLASEVSIFVEPDDFPPPAIDTRRRTYAITIPIRIFVECIDPTLDVSAREQALDEGSISSICALLCNCRSYGRPASSGAILALRAETFKLERLYLSELNPTRTSESGAINGFARRSALNALFTSLESTRLIS